MTFVTEVVSADIIQAGSAKHGVVVDNLHIKDGEFLDVNGVPILSFQEDHTADANVVVGNDEDSAWVGTTAGDLELKPSSGVVVVPVVKTSALESPSGTIECDAKLKCNEIETVALAVGGMSIGASPAATAYEAATTTHNPAVADLTNMTGTPVIHDMYWSRFGSINLMNFRITGLSTEFNTPRTFARFVLPVPAIAKVGGIGGSCRVYYHSSYTTQAGAIADYLSNDAAHAGFEFMSLSKNAKITVYVCAQWHSAS